MKLTRWLALVALAAFLPAGPAQAWIPLDTCYGGVMTHWEDLPTEWRLRDKLSGQRNFYSPLTDTAVTNAVQGGWTVWHNPASCRGSFESVNGGTTTVSFDANSPINVIEFEENSWSPSYGDVNSTIAITYPVYYTQSCEIVDSDQIYNGVGFNFTTTSSPDYNDTDLQSITAHENGHWLGLGHTSVANATMAATYAGGISDRVLHVDDEEGLCTLYPGPNACSATNELPCNGSVNGNSAGGLNEVESWSCSEYTMTGPEAVYSLKGAGTGTVTIDLSNLQADVDLFVTTGLYNACDPESCIEASYNSDLTAEHISFEATGGTVYYVVIDGWEGATSSFRLTTTCPTESNCTDGLDDDSDYLSDCDDPDCEGLTPDTDGDGVCDFDDLCDGNDVTGDTDHDGICNDEDLCRGNDATGDSDGDGVCDNLDACEGSDVIGDRDGDGICDDQDLCYGDDATGDADGDEVCDNRDECDGDDDSGDADGDGYCALDAAGETWDCADDDPDVYPGGPESCDGPDDTEEEGGGLFGDSAACSSRAAPPA
jgi:hypothetical protein